MKLKNSKSKLGDFLINFFWKLLVIAILIFPPIFTYKYKQVTGDPILFVISLAVDGVLIMLIYSIWKLDKKKK